MIDNDTVSRSDLSLKTRLLNVASSGVLAGSLTAILDTVQAAPALHSAGEKGLLFLQAIGRSSVAGGILAAIAALVAVAGEMVARRKDASPTARRLNLSAALSTTLAAAPFCIYIAVRLFQGGLTSRLPARGVLMVLSALVLIAIIFAVSRIAASLIRRADRAPRVSIFHILLAILLAVTAVAAHWADGNLYKRLYLYLHGVLGIITFSSLIVAIRMTVHRNTAATRSSRFQFGSLVVATLLFIVAFFTFNGRQTVKVAAFENTATTANLLQAFSRPTSSTRRGQPSKEIIALREERNRKARLAASGDYPVFPGAHVLFITIDALRADRMGLYGHTKRDLTPNLDVWAKDRAVVFERAYCTAPHSSFSITSFHTARYAHDEAMLQREVTHPTLAEVLGDAGYKTLGYYTQGIFFTEGEKVAHYRRNKFGFQKHHGGGPPADVLSDRVIADIDRIVLQGEPPTLFWVHYFNVHEPYESTRFGTTPSDGYDGEIALMDEGVIRVIEHAEKVLEKGVVIAFAADHGEEFKDHGGYYHGSTLYDEQVRVPLIFQVPGGAPGRITAPVSLTGIAPSLLKLVGVIPAPSMLGQDLRPAIFKGNDAHVAQPVFAAVVNQHMVVRWPWKFIFDPSSDRYSLFNLQTDPLERFNVYDQNKALSEELNGELRSWLDEMGKDEDEARTILNMGHMRDARAVPGLIDVMANPEHPQEVRVEAARLLGAIRDYSAVPHLLNRLNDKNIRVATEAAFALGELGDLAGQDLMRDALYDDDPDIRDRAALVLGRQGDVFATPQLIEALGRDNVRIREKATKMLGMVRDPSSTEALIDQLAEIRLRYLTVTTLGKIGDPRAFDPLMEILDIDKHTDTRGYAVAALGRLGNPKAIPRLLQILEEESAIKWTPEALVRLNAIGKSPLYGTDVFKGAKSLRHGWGNCTEKPLLIHGEYMDRTTCQTIGPRAELTFSSDTPEGGLIIVRARHKLEGTDKPVPLEIYVNGKKTHTVHLTHDFAQTRLETPPGVLKEKHANNHILLKLGKNGTFELDHFLVLSIED